MKLPVGLVGFSKASEYSFNLKHAAHIVTSYEAYQNLCDDYSGLRIPAVSITRSSYLRGGNCRCRFSRGGH
jgi:hypothetical protein